MVKWNDNLGVLSSNPVHFIAPLSRMDVGNLHVVPLVNILFLFSFDFKLYF